MKPLQRSLQRMRGVPRRLMGRLVANHPTVVRPEHLVVRLDLPSDSDLESALSPDALGPWQAWLVDAIHWSGPRTVTVYAGQHGASPLACELIRFAHRLDCPTRLICNGEGLDDLAANELLHAGLQAVRIEIEHHSDAAAVAARSMRAAALQQRAVLDVEVAMVWSASVVDDFETIVDWSRREGCDGVRVIAPWHGSRAAPPSTSLRQWLETEGPLNRSEQGVLETLSEMSTQGEPQPGTRKQSGERCRIAHRRIERNAAGDVRCCPFKDPFQEAETLDVQWQQGRTHLQAIATCERSCSHLLLC